MHVIYITFDGLLEPLGASQIVTPLVKLAGRGIRYTIASLEKPADLAQTDRVGRLRDDLRTAGIEWYPGLFVAGDTKANVRALLLSAVTVGWSASLIHARGHTSAGVAYVASRIRRIPFFFDMRGYWMEERLEEGNWTTTSIPYRLGKRLEGHLLRSAAAVSCLTRMAADDLRIRRQNSCVETITTVADYERFQRCGPTSAVPPAVATRLRDRLVVSYIGSVNASYSTKSALSLAQRVLCRRPDAIFLVLSRQSNLMTQLVERADLPADRTIVACAHHEDMHEWLRLIDWSIVFLNSPPAKRGSMPTKLAELFASGVYVAQHGCNPEVEAWVRRVPTGLWLEDLSDRSLDQAADEIASMQLADVSRAQTRTMTAGFFSLDSGVDAYESLLRSLR